MPTSQTSVTDLREPLQLETAGGDLSLDTVGDLEASFAVAACSIPCTA